ncbi:hypothetical protein [Methanoplanus limicola]|uniref:Uncharacterized protein n=1 Tax=Methanoplanus limicola DSM 2279 TaxID=937775 RepID=H1Z234_9EURY|nr:hypothetical protein [Methanoplanus limicola]EHQ36379.1 hypothetical protein Metlim_2325 [Methanoplanus limicola DSM 2279]
MADFIETSNTKASTREFTDSINDLTVFQSVITSLIADNPFECTSYYQSGVETDGIEKSKEYYNAKFIFEDNDAKTVGTLSVKCPTVAAYNAAVTAVLADTDLAAAIGGDCIHSSEKDTFSCTLKCHDPNSEIYYLTLTKDKARLTSYQDEAIRTKVETWADGVTALL